MTDLQVRCDYCKKNIYRKSGWLNENKKLGQRNFCSLACLGKSRMSRIKLMCENSKCNKTFERKKSNISPHNYCSHSCAMIVNNSKFPKRKALVKTCLFCGKNYIGGAIKFCSTKCQYQAAMISSSTILRLITDFVDVNGRIPTKREFPHYRAIRDRFGTWNNAVKSAGFHPNQVLFAKKYIASDGHKCDSLSEKIIDDWLYARKIKHIRNCPYPGDLKFTVDFKVDDYWIEFFGLSGELKKYDELKEIKLKLAKRNKLKLIEIYPKDLFPTSRLNNILGKIVK